MGNLQVCYQSVIKHTALGNTRLRQALLTVILGQDFPDRNCYSGFLTAQLKVKFDQTPSRTFNRIGPFFVSCRIKNKCVRTQPWRLKSFLSFPSKLSRYCSICPTSTRNHRSFRPFLKRLDPSKSVNSVSDTIPTISVFSKDLSNGS